jgi:hypothetical protein
MVELSTLAEYSAIVLLDIRYKEVSVFKFKIKHERFINKELVLTYAENNKQSKPKR